MNTDFIHRKNSAAVFHGNTDTLHSRDVRCPHPCLRKAALTSSGWSDRYPEVKIKPFRLQALTGKHTVYERSFKRFRLTDTLFCYIQVSQNLWPDDVYMWVSPVTPSVFPPESSGSFESSPPADPEPPARCPWVTSSVRPPRSCSPVYFSCCGGERKRVHISLKRQMGE